MDEAAREAFLAAFDAENPETLIGFCVMGGIYSEGIDLKGDRLIGTVIVVWACRKLAMSAISSGIIMTISRAAALPMPISFPA